MSPTPDPFVFDHLGIVCANLLAGREAVGPVHGVRAWTTEVHDPIQRVDVQFGFSPSGPVIELISPHGEDSPIKEVLERRVNVLNHVAYRVAAMDEAIERCRGLGYFPVSAPAPAVAYGGRLICFLYSPADFLIELVEGLEFRHQFELDASGKEDW